MSQTYKQSNAYLLKEAWLLSREFPFNKKQIIEK